jgi:transposase InsO family protein
VALVQQHGRFVLPRSALGSIGALWNTGNLQHRPPRIRGCAQFTSPQFTSILLAHSVRISMDGRSRALDNVFCERLWRSVKYECLYLRGLESVPEVREALIWYFDLHNNRKPHQALNYKTPKAVFESGRIGLLLKQ